MNTRSRILSTAFSLFILFFSGSGHTCNAQKIESKGEPTPASSRVAALGTKLRKGDRSALSQFWEDVRKSGTPLIEPLPSDGKNVLVTFLWRGTKDTQNVVIF